jgi:DHA1 family bicyclomycin/chloramphenicol resistance-like MFS transporter
MEVKQVSAAKTFNSKGIVYLVSFAAFFGPFSQSIYTPLLPGVQQQFGATEYLVNLTISIFTFVMAFMQIVYGPLTDAAGRRKTLLPGIGLYIVASVGAALSHTIYLLLFFRIVQAAGIAVGSVVAVTVIGDLYEGKFRGRAMGIFQTLVALGPVVGPVLGGFVGQYFGINAVFWVLAAAGSLLLLLCVGWLPETKPPHQAARRFRLADFGLVLTRPAGLAVMVLGFFQYFSMYIFLVFLPAFLVLQYGLSPAENGLVFLPLSLCVVIGSMAGGRLQEHFNARRFLLVTASVNALSIFIFAAVAPLSLPVLLSSISLFGLCLGLSLPVQTTLLTNEFHHNRARLRVCTIFRATWVWPQGPWWVLFFTT